MLNLITVTILVITVKFEYKKEEKTFQNRHIFLSQLALKCVRWYLQLHNFQNFPGTCLRTPLEAHIICTFDLKVLAT